MKSFKILFWVVLLASAASAQKLGLKVCESGASPTVCKTGIKEIYVTPGTLTITGEKATISISGGGGSGDVVGPASATDNAAARFDLATGKLLQNSVVLIGDTGAVTGVAALTISGVFTAGSGPTTVTDAAGKILSAALNTVQPAQGGTGITALGTGVAAALGVNIGSAGAPVLFNGAGGTPSSLTLTNATGLPPTTGISGWPDNASGVLTNNGSGTLSWAAAGSEITIDTTAITSGKAQRVLFESATNKVSEAAGFTFDGTSALTLGVAGTSVGSVAFKNATSGTITMQPVTGALGTVTLSLPATTSTLAGLAIAQTFTANQAITATVTTGTGTSSGFSVAADSLTTGTGANFASSSVTSGSVVNIASTSTAAASSTLKGLNIAISGANGTTAQTVTGAAISVTNTNATSGTNVALTLTASGATTANTALRVTAGRVLIPDGTAALPAYSFTSAFTSGLYIDLGGLLNFSQSGVSRFQITNQPSMRLAATTRFEWNDGTLGSGGPDLILRRATTANLAFGAADAASPVAQTLSVQNVVGGTTDTAGANWTLAASRGTGTGAGGDVIVQTAPAAASTASTQNALVTAFTVKGNGAVQLKSVTNANLPTVANGYLIYCSDCTIASPCAGGGTGALAKGINGAWVCN